MYGLTDDIKTWHPDSGFSDRKEPYFVTHGVNMMEVMACADVDFTRTTCNDLIEIFESLGIEAARSGMLNEIRSVLFFDGGYINYRHMSILVDVMTFRGALTAVSRHGINRGEQGPLLRASFEETVEVLNQASLFGEYDDIQVYDTAIRPSLALLLPLYPFLCYTSLTPGCFNAPRVPHTSTLQHIASSLPFALPPSSPRV